MSPYQIKEAIEKNLPLFGICNRLNNLLAVDCFDEVRLFATYLDAEQFCNAYIPYNCGNYDVKFFENYSEVIKFYETYASDYK